MCNLIPVTRYEGYYVFSYETNQVFSLDRTIEKVYSTHKRTSFIKGKELKGFKNKYGHIYFDLYLLGQKEKTSMHKIVAEYSYGKGQEGMEVCHNDGNPNNNYPHNLRYGTHKENMNDMVIHGHTGFNKGKTGRRSKLSKTIHQYDINMNHIATHYGTSEIYELYGYDCSNISKACRGIIKQSYGFIWRYE